MKTLMRLCFESTVLLLLIFTFSHEAFSVPPELLPPSFTIEGKKAVPVDFQSVALNLHFNVATKKATAEGKVHFKVIEEGYPILDMVPTPTIVRFDGKEIPVSTFAEIRDPQSVTKLRLLKELVREKSEHTLEVAYVIPADDVTFTTTGVRMGMFMDDVSSVDGRGFLEQYAPSNLEFDQFSLTIRVTIDGSGANQRLFTNGIMSQIDQAVWNITFPDYFTSSSPYLHISDQAFNTDSTNHKGIAKDIPITVYAESASLAKTALERAVKVMGELESTYGPYAHQKFLAYVTPSGGGMEYCGATMTSLSALPHELTHSWFARGVMPANGNAGWIDEAIASWRDAGYPTANANPNRPPVNLGAFAPYRRSTPGAAYSSGMLFMSELDFLFKNTGGLKNVLKTLFAQKKRDLVTTPMFHGILEKFSNLNLGASFSRYVYGKADDTGFWALDFPSPEIMENSQNELPRRFTKDELLRFR